MTAALGGRFGTVTHQTRSVLLEGAGAMVPFARRIEPPVKVFAPALALPEPGPMSAPPPMLCAKTVPPEMLTVPPSLLWPPPMPAPYSPPVAASEAVSSPNALAMESVRPAATSRPALYLPEASVFAPARMSETLAPVPSAKAHWYSPDARSVRFESVTSHDTPSWTTTRTQPAVLVPESVNGPESVSLSVGQTYVHPSPFEPAESIAMPLIVTPVGTAKGVAAQAVINAAWNLLRGSFFMTAFLLAEDWRPECPKPDPAWFLQIGGGSCKTRCLQVWHRILPVLHGRDAHATRVL